MTADILRAIVALLFVLGLLWLLSFLIKKYGWKLGLPTTPLVAGQRRLKLIEVLSLDTRNKIILVRQDNAEHLLLLGGQEAVIIEKNLPAQESEKIS